MKPIHSHQDTHAADIKAALAKRGITLTGLAEQGGYHRSATGKALRQPWPAVERIIAKALGRCPHEIWPSRYLADGRPKSERAGRKVSTRRSLRNVQKSRAA